ncbi:MAG TPA: restriction endonuclease subunit S [Hanamia sp.]|nr:restriction endonuclease subunit S [Hanamia sp.]
MIEKLGKVITHRKQFITIDNSVEYKRCRVQVSRKGVVLRDVIKGVAINTKKQQVCKEGDFLVAEIDAKVGGYGFVGKELEGAIVSSHYFLFEVDESKMLKDYLAWLIKTNIIQDQISSKGSTNYAAIRPSHVLDFEIPLPSIVDQTIIVSRLNNINAKYSLLDKELTQQQTYLQLLRQTILQEAVQGKLTKQNAKDEPATELLKRIKAEKQKLIKAGKLKKEKELPSITEDEIPFELPEGWVWCRLYEVGILKRGKSKHRPRNDRNLFINGTYPFIQTGEVSQAKKQNGLITSINGYYNEVGLKQSEMQKQGTLCITIAANIAEYGFLNIDACVPDSIVCFNAVDEVISKYVSYFINVSKDMLEQFAPSTAQKNINLGILSELKFPLPPLAEQHHIVAKVQQLQQQLSQLETQVQQSREYAQQLLQSVLREAFEEKGKVYEMGEEKAWMVAEE